MRCNRKIVYFAVTPHEKVVGCLNITDIWQLRRRENSKAKIADFIQTTIHGPLIKQIGLIYTDFSYYSLVKISVNQL